MREVPTNTASMFFGRDWMSFFEKMPLSETIVMCFGMCFAIFLVVARSTLKVFKSLLLMPMILAGVLSAFLSSSSVWTSQRTSMPRVFASLVKLVIWVFDRRAAISRIASAPCFLAWNIWFL